MKYLSNAATQLHNTNTRIYISLLAALALVVGAIALNEYAYRASLDAQRVMTRSLNERSLLYQLLQQTLDAETGQRGYMITGEEKYLQPYIAATKHIEQTMNSLRNVYVGRQDSMARFSPLTRGISRKLAELDMTIRVRQTNSDEAVWRAIVETGIGNDYMENVRSVAHALIDDATQQIAAQDVQIKRSMSFSRVAIPLMSVAAFLAFGMYVLQSLRLARSFTTQQQELQHERDQLGKLVDQRTTELSELTTHLQNVQEQEREHLARELHDELGALLTAAKLDVSRIRSKLDTDTKAVYERLQHLTTTLNAGIALKRRIIEDLRPSTLSKLGLNPALEILLREFGERSGIAMHASLDPVSMGVDTDLAIYRLVQESLTNAAKYAKASEITVTLHQYPRHVEITVSDNGVGFDVTQREGASHGLQGMRHRMTARQGTFQVHSTPGQGTRIEATLPRLHSPERAAEEPALDAEEGAATPSTLGDTTT